MLMSPRRMQLFTCFMVPTSPMYVSNHAFLSVSYAKFIRSWKIQKYLSPTVRFFIYMYASLLIMYKPPIYSSYENHSMLMYISSCAWVHTLQWKEFHFRCSRNQKPVLIYIIVKCQCRFGCVMTRPGKLTGYLYGSENVGSFISLENSMQAWRWRWK